MTSRHRRRSIKGWHLRLKAAREASGMRQTDLAALIGVSTATLSDWEAGKIDEPKASNLLAIAEALNVSPDAILYARPVGLVEPAAPARPADGGSCLPPDLSPELVRLWSELAPGQRNAFLTSIRGRVRENREVLTVFGECGQGPGAPQ